MISQKGALLFDPGRYNPLTAPEQPGLLPFSRAGRRAARLCQAKVTTRTDGNLPARSRSGGVNQGKPFPMPGSGERFRYGAYHNCQRINVGAMTLGERIASVFQMDDEAWRRHANPWSVWTRNTVPPLLILAFWSRIWLGWWSLLAVTAALLWTWLNPRLFSPPDSMESWASKGVLGERVWLNREEVPVPEHHRSVPTLLSTISGIGVGIIIWGVANLELWPTAFGTAVLYFGNLWHFDRMVWLYEDMKEATPEYESWQSQTSVESAP